MQAATPSQNGAIFAVTLRVNFQMCGLRPDQEAPSRQRRDWTALRPIANVEFTVTTRTEPLTLLSKASARPGRRWRARPHERGNRAGRSGGCLHHRGRQWAHADYSSPLSRTVQLLVTDQQIASALRLAG
jgi:hypothetical protein